MTPPTWPALCSSSSRFATHHRGVARRLGLATADAMSLSIFAWTVSMDGGCTGAAGEARRLRGRRRNDLSRHALAESSSRMTPQSFHSAGEPLAAAAGRKGFSDFSPEPDLALADSPPACAEGGARCFSARGSGCASASAMPADDAEVTDGKVVAPPRATALRLPMNLRRPASASAVAGWSIAQSRW